jgi:uncharacterized protein YdeI (YjbR/CyaY-like superfamily)
MKDSTNLTIPEDVEFKINKIEKARIIWDSLRLSKKREYLI